MQLRRCGGDYHACTQRSLTSNKRTMTSCGINLLLSDVSTSCVHTPRLSIPHWWVHNAMLDGDKRANVHPSFNAKQRCPLSPLLFSFTWTTAWQQPGWEGAGRDHGRSQSTATHLLFADDLSLTSTDHNELQTMLNQVRVYAQKKSLTVNAPKSEVMWFNSRPGSFLPLLFFDGTQLPYTDTFKYFCMVCDRQTNLILRLTQLCDHSWLDLSQAICQEPWPC